MKLWFEGWNVNAHDASPEPVKATPAAIAVPTGAAK
jgi:hypothetical protein